MQTLSKATHKNIVTLLHCEVSIGFTYIDQYTNEAFSSRLMVLWQTAYFVNNGI